MQAIETFVGGPVGYVAAVDVYRRHPSKVAGWADGELKPLDVGDGEVWFAIPVARRRDDQVWEALNVELLGEDVAEIRGVPVFASGVAWGDRVSVMGSAEGALVATSVLERAGFATFRLWLGEDSERPEWRRCAEVFAKLGCVVDVYSERLIAVGIPGPGVDEVRLTLDEYVSEQPDWSWEEASTEV